ncbi:hypothetical protein CC1G_09312 [Coprinopsis cinerea okayama7|uniref:Uncharacterized protein n=1 Tax=Coprinopsis cinerea (strain Okayama-7 / 130 / ATCC MYA-4618 / FGSC 9003) TaxID=240176 RepID=A8N5K7_COPC7|nr:hypothetical protein CC1G_09312 [Coprinopsis cinerea okayama7\|eukprot:XP_001830152.2 hypothetical protein CC1G_09312 [Coprinopsis cinerea okayama7\
MELPKGNRSSLPSWLMNTFKTLVDNHPLKLLLPSSARACPSSTTSVSPGLDSVSDSSTTCVESMEPASTKERIFAFDPFDPDQESIQSSLHGRTRHTPPVQSMHDPDVGLSQYHVSRTVRAESPVKPAVRPGPSFWSSPIWSKRIPSHSPTLVSRNPGPTPKHITSFDLSFSKPDFSNHASSSLAPAQDDPFAIEQLDSDYFSHIYATAGPCSSVIGVGFSDQGSEETSDAQADCLHTHPDLDDFSTVGFTWSKFDRNSIQAPPLPQRPIYRLDEEYIHSVFNLEDSVVQDFVSERMQPAADPSKDTAVQPEANRHASQPHSRPATPWINSSTWELMDNSFATGNARTPSPVASPVVKAAKPAFAPAPGIFISPLQTSSSSPSKVPALTK